MLNFRAITSNLPKAPYVATTTAPHTVVKEVTFHTPDFTETIPTWDHERVDLDNNWIITSVPEGFEKVPHKDLISDPSISGVFFTPKVWNELVYVVEQLADKTGECGMFAAVKPISGNADLYNRKPHYLVYDWFMPKQTASSGEVKLDAPDCQKYFDYLQKTYPHEFGNGNLHTNLMHIHSHHRMNLRQWSGTDLNQQNRRDELGWAGLHRLFFLFTIGHGVKCTQVSYYPTLTRKDCYVGLCYAEPEYVVALTKARKKELDKIMADVVHETPRAYPHNFMREEWDFHDGRNTIWQQETCVTPTKPAAKTPTAPPAKPQQNFRFSPEATVLNLVPKHKRKEFHENIATISQALADYFSNAMVEVNPMYYEDEDPLLANNVDLLQDVLADVPDLPAECAEVLNELSTQVTHYFSMAMDAPYDAIDVKDLCWNISMQIPEFITQVAAMLAIPDSISSSILDKFHKDETVNPYITYKLLIEMQKVLSGNEFIDDIASGLVASLLED